MMVSTATLDAARALLVKRVGGTPKVTEASAPANMVLIRAGHPDAAPGTGVATLLVGKEGRFYGAHTDGDLGSLIDSISLDLSPKGARELAELVVLGWLDGLFTVLDVPPAALKTTVDGLRLTATIRGGLAPAPEQLVCVVPSTAKATIARTPLPAPPPPTPINRAAALERALIANDAMAISTALRELSGELDDKEMTVVARVVLASSGPLEVMARQRLGGGPRAEAALARARED